MTVFYPAGRERENMRQTILRKLALVYLAFLLILTGIPEAYAETEERPAEDLTRHMRIEQSTGHSNAASQIRDDDLSQTFSYFPYEQIRLTWEKAPKKAVYLCIQWGTPPERVRIRQLDENGALLSDAYADPVYDGVIPLTENTAAVTVTAGPEGMEFARIALFSEGTLPAPFFPWKDTPKGMDYLIVSTHPDDDVLFMGGIIPTYGAEQGYVGTVAYVTIPSRKRVNEASLCAWEMGTQYRPVFLGFSDIGQPVKDNYLNRFLPETVTLALVRMLREYRPLVVFSHDMNGEYGHWQHKIVSASVLEACRLSADPEYDPLSYAEFGTWEVKKSYLHLYEENLLIMDISTPLESRGGRTALEVALDAFKLHKSQQNGRHEVEDENGKYAMNRFGMAYGTVEAGNDVFDNIDPALLSNGSYTEMP